MLTRRSSAASDIQSSLSFCRLRQAANNDSLPFYCHSSTPATLRLQSFTVDVNLVHAGVASQTGRVSRRHALISLKSDGEFYIKNIGKRPIDVNGRPVWRGTKCRLPHDSLIEIANIFLLFSINTPFVAKIQRQLRQKTLL